MKWILVSCGPPGKGGTARGVLAGGILVVHGKLLLTVQNFHGQSISAKISFPTRQRQKPFWNSNKMIDGAVFHYSYVLKHPFIPFVCPMQILDKATSSPWVSWACCSPWGRAPQCLYFPQDTHLFARVSRIVNKVFFCGEFSKFIVSFIAAFGFWAKREAEGPQMNAEGKGKYCTVCTTGWATLIWAGSRGAGDMELWTTCAQD